MTKSSTQKFFAGLLIVVGVVLLAMFAVIRASRGNPSNGMLVVGLVDLIVGIVLLKRANSMQGAS